MGRIALSLFLAAVLFGTACENEFSPKTDIVEKVAVFCVLDQTQDFQTVLLARSYDADLGLVLQPLTSKEVLEADVRILGGGQTYVFKDTVVDVDGGGTRTAWVNRELIPKPEVLYRLQVKLPGEPLITSEVVMPSRMYVRAERAIVDTGSGPVKVHPGVTGFAVPADAFYYRLFSETWKLQPMGDTVKSRLEIPLYFAPGGEWVYSSPSRSVEVFFIPGVIRQVKEINEAVSDSVIGRRLIVKGYGLDKQFYSYYKVARGFDDPLSVRLDHPDLSFIEGGLGVFGGMVADSNDYSIYSFIR
jgi:hypothetical protein